MDPPEGLGKGASGSVSVAMVGSRELALHAPKILHTALRGQVLNPTLTSFFRL